MSADVPRRIGSVERHVAVEVVQRRRDRARGRHEADLADALDAVRARWAAATRRGSPRSRGTSFGRMMPRLRSVMFVGRPSASRGEVLGQRVAEAHVHRALDLALAQQRVHRPADVVRGHDLARRRRSRGRRPRAARRSRTWSGSPGARGLRPASSSSRRGTRPRSRRRAGSRRPRWPRRTRLHRARAHQRAAAAGGLARAELAGGVDDDADRGPGRRRAPRPRPARATVCTPWPISVQQWRTSTVPSSSKRTTARAISLKPLPRPEFFSPRPSPTAAPAATAAS